VKYTIGNAIHLAKRIAWSLNIMHKKGFVHDDIKPANILLDCDEEEPLFPVISDFGNTKVLNSAEVVAGMEIVAINGISVHFAAPEKVKAFKHRIRISSTTKMDVYSYGIVFYCIFSRKKKLVVANDLVIQSNVMFELPDFLQNEWKEMIMKILELCCNHDAAQRASMDEIYEKIAKY
jgi:serine/threonine protein kinase